MKQILYTAALMVGIALPSRLLSTPFRGGFSGDFLTEIIIPLAATVAGGAVAIRYMGLRWPQPLFAALIAAPAGIAPDVWRHLGYQGGIRAMLQPGLIQMTIGAAGAFLLPLLDPKVRAQGPAPTRWKVAMAATVLTLLLAGTELAVQLSKGSVWLYGLTTFWLGGIGSLMLGVAGLILTVAGATRVGAWVGR